MSEQFAKSYPNIQFSSMHPGYTFEYKTITQTIYFKPCIVKLEKIKIPIKNENNFPSLINDNYESDSSYDDLFEVSKYKDNKVPSSYDDLSETSEIKDTESDSSYNDLSETNDESSDEEYRKTRSRKSRKPFNPYKKSKINYKGLNLRKTDRRTAFHLHEEKNFESFITNLGNGTFEYKTPTQCIQFRDCFVRLEKDEDIFEPVKKKLKFPKIENGRSNEKDYQLGYPTMKTHISTQNLAFDKQLTSTKNASKADKFSRSKNLERSVLQAIRLNGNSSTRQTRLSKGYAMESSIRFRSNVYSTYKKIELTDSDEDGPDKENYTKPLKKIKRKIQGNSNRRVHAKIKHILKDKILSKNGKSKMEFNKDELSTIKKVTPNIPEEGLTMMLLDSGMASCTMKSPKVISKERLQQLSSKIVNRKLKIFETGEIFIKDDDLPPINYQKIVISSNNKPLIRIMRPIKAIKETLTNINVVGVGVKDCINSSGEKTESSTVGASPLNLVQMPQKIPDELLDENEYLKVDSSTAIITNKDKLLELDEVLDGIIEFESEQKSGTNLIGIIKNTRYAVSDL